MSYKAIITTIQIKPHSNADKLELAVVETGEQVVVGKGIHKSGDRVVYFSEGGQLSPEYVSNNNEYRKNEGVNKDPEKFGFFDEKRRVKIIKLRKEVSNGYVSPFTAFSWLGQSAIDELNSLPIGTELDTVASHQFCEKYFTRATRERMAGKPGEPKQRFSISGFDKHFDTSRLERHYNALPDNAVFYISEKIHATSGRTGLLPCSYSRPPTTWYGKLYNKFMNLIGHRQSTDVTDTFLISGSRNVDFNPLIEANGDGYRARATRCFEGNLNAGETVFYELCCTGSGGAAIQNASVNKTEEFGKEIAKKYGEHIEYDYGVAPGEIKCFVYRMTQQVDGGNTLELSWNQVLRRIREMRDEHIVPVPFVGPFCNKSEISQRIKDYIGDGKDKLGNHPIEGCCLRVEHPLVPTNMSILKVKAPEFCYLEGIARNNDAFIDPEEVS